MVREKQKSEQKGGEKKEKFRWMNGDYKVGGRYPTGQLHLEDPEGNPRKKSLPISHLLEYF